MGQIYKATDLTNNFIYIGKTTKNVNERKKDHLSKAKRCVNNIRFHNAIRSHGRVNFIWEVIEECSDELLNEKEIFYIKKYKSNDKAIGYNMTKGGDNDPTVNIGRKKSKETCLKISRALKGKKRSKEHRRNMGNAQVKRYKNDPIMRRNYRLMIENNCKSVCQYDLNGNFIRVWRSAVDAGKEVGVDPSNINRVCLREYKTCRSFIWRYENDIVTENDLINLTKVKPQSEYTIKKRAESQHKKVLQYSKNMEFIQEWYSIKEAGIKLQIDNGGISRACRSIQKKAGGYKWRYK